MYSIPSEQYFDYSTGFVGGPEFGLIINLLSFTALILQIVGIALVFQKAGEQWWKALIPFYNYWTEAKIARAPQAWFWLFTGLFIGGGIVMTGGFVFLMISAFADAEAMILLSVVILLASIAMLIASMVFYWRILLNLSKSFGKGMGFSLGLLFLAPIFWMILALDKSQYQQEPTPTIQAAGGAQAAELTNQYVQQSQQQASQSYDAFGNPIQPAYSTPAFDAQGNPIPSISPVSSVPSPYAGQSYDAYGSPIPQTEQYAQQPQAPFQTMQQQAPVQQPQQAQYADLIHAPAQFQQNSSQQSAFEIKEKQGPSRGAIVVIICAILVPILACCTWANWLMNLAGQTTISGQPPLF